MAEPGGCALKQLEPNRGVTVCIAAIQWLFVPITVQEAPHSDHRMKPTVDRADSAVEEVLEGCGRNKVLQAQATQRLPRILAIIEAAYGGGKTLVGLPVVIFEIGAFGTDGI